ncbi:MAG: hypothetical protein PWQ37_2347 [Candidatus Petromonas sp.]|jgi:hypothetical protein|nr:hypothetical protein [Candidatus Petromonas sp.]
MRKKLDIKNHEIVLLKDGTTAQVVYVFATFDAIRVRLENGIFTSIKSKDIKNVLQN